MGSVARHLMLEYGRRSTTVNGPAVPTALRDLWVVRYRLAEVTTPITVVIEASPDATTGSWEELDSTVLSAPGVTSVTGNEGAGLVVEPYHSWVRVRVTVASAEYVLSVVAEAPFLHTSDDDLDDLLSGEARSNSRSLQRWIEAAEQKVLEHYEWDASGSSLLDLEDARFPDRIRRAIAAQVEREILLEKARIRAEKDDKKIKNLAELDPRVETLLGVVLLGSAAAPAAGWVGFRGRG